MWISRFDTAQWLITMAATLTATGGILLPASVTAEFGERSADATAPSRDDAERWVRQLSDPSFAVRNKASRRLLAAGTAVKEVVRGASKSGDREVRYRAWRILAAIERREIAARREAFVDGDLAKLPGNCASWRRLVELVGNRRAARELFWQIQTEAADYLELSEMDPEEAIQQIEDLYDAYMLAYRGRGPRVAPGKIAAVFLLACRKDIELEESAMKQCASLLYGKYRLSDDALSGLEDVAELYNSDNEAFRTLAGRWVLKQYSRRNPTNVLSVSRKLKIPEGLELARRMLEGNKHAGAYKSYALKTIGALGSERDVPLLERYLDNGAWVGSVRLVGKGNRGKVTLGDLALAMCVKLTGQDPTDYGFPKPPPPRQIGNQPKPRYGFFNNQDRAAARAKWREWKRSKNSHT